MDQIELYVRLGESIIKLLFIPVIAVVVIKSVSTFEKGDRIQGIYLLLFAIIFLLVVR